MAQFPAPEEALGCTHFIVARDVERSRRFYVEVLGGRGGVRGGALDLVALANGWIINVGGRTDRRQTDGDARAAFGFWMHLGISEHPRRGHPGRLSGMERSRG